MDTARALGAFSHTHIFEPLVKIGAKTVVVNLVAVDAALTPVAAGAGMDLNILKYMITLFLAYPLGLIFGILPSIKPLKHFLSFIIGFIFVQWVFGPEWIHSFLSAAFTYGACMFAPRKILGPMTFWVVLGYMVACHAYKMYMNSLTGLPYWQYALDFTGCQMVLTMKLTSFAYNVADGARLKAKGVTTKEEPVVAEGTKRVTRSSTGSTPSKKEKDTSVKAIDDKEARKIAEKEKLEESQRSFALDKLPSPLEFLGYVYCFSSIMVGPTFEYSLYEKAVAGIEPTRPSGKGTPAVGIMNKLGRFVNSNAYIAALHRLLLALACMGGYQMLANAGYMSYHNYNPASIAGKSYWELFSFMALAMQCQRFKFFFIWKMAEGACILAGFGFSGYDKNGESLGYRAAENMDILGFELATNIQVVSRCWNKGTQTWLERYAYNRLNKSTFWVYFVSSVWHGVYPGFFIMFLTVPILTSIERLMKTKINPIIVPEYDGRNVATYPSHLAGTIYWWLCFVGRHFVFNFITQTFSMGWWTNSVTALAAYDWIPYYMFIAMWVVLNFIVPNPKSKKD